MNRVISIYAFVCGCAGSVLALVWQCLAVFGHPLLPRSIWTVEAIFVFHALAMLATFRRNVREIPRSPLFVVTRRRVKIARLLLCLVAINFALCVIVCFVSHSSGNATLNAWAVPLVLTSFMLLNTVYIALHWAFRPANIFSKKIVRIASNPARVVHSGKTSKGGPSA